MHSDTVNIDLNSKKSRFWIRILIILTIICALVGGTLFGQSRADLFAREDAQFHDALPQAPATGNSDKIHIRYDGEGIFLVPQDIKPGKYTLTSDDDAFGCIWKILGKLDRKDSSVIKQGITKRGGHSEFTISNQKAVSMDGSCIWMRLV